MLWIFALQFLFYARVMFAPKAGKVLRDLDRAHVGREDVDEDGNATHRDFGCGIDIVEFLNAQGDMRRIADFVRNFGSFAIGKVEAFRSVLIEEFLLSRAKP